MRNGWIKLHRKLMYSDGYFQEPFCRNMAWVDLLLLANHEPRLIIVRGNRVTVNRGQVGYSLEALAERWRWSLGKTRRFIIFLEKTEKIAWQKNLVKPLISIVKYEQYQSGDSPDDMPDDSPDRRPDDRANKNEKNYKNEKNINTKGRKTKNLTEIVWPVGWDNRFTELWDAYKQYRTAEGKGWYRSLKTEQTAVNNLWSDCMGDATVAEEMVKRTIGSRWTGLFAIKQQQHGNNQTSKSSPSKATQTLLDLAKTGNF